MAEQQQIMQEPELATCPLGEPWELWLLAPAPSQGPKP